MIDHGLDLAVIGNGHSSALVDPTARLVWWCFPRFDSDPIFCRPLAGDEEKGFADVVLDALTEFKSSYLRNTAIVSTELSDARGGIVRVTDFAPRFRQFGRIFRPPQLIRIIEPDCPASPSGPGRRKTTAIRLRDTRPAAITSATSTMAPSFA